jgi:hypothetical protein
MKGARRLGQFRRGAIVGLSALALWEWGQIALYVVPLLPWKEKDCGCKVVKYLGPPRQRAYRWLDNTESLIYPRTGH